jgi:hypothetical protein
MNRVNTAEVSVDELLYCVRLASKRRRILVFAGLATLWISATVGAFCYRRIMDNALLGDSHLLIALCALCMFGSIPLCILLSLPSGPNRLMLARIARQADVSAAGPLIELVEEIQLDDTRNVLRRALIKLLPRVEECHVNSRQLHKLNSALDAASKTLPSELQARYCIAILKAITHIGDECSLFVVRKLATQTTDNVRRARIQAAAAECLPNLESRISSCRTPGNLLHALDCAPSSERLLLPVGSSLPDAESTLLRSCGKK